MGLHTGGLVARSSSYLAVSLPSTLFFHPSASCVITEQLPNDVTVIALVKLIWCLSLALIEFGKEPVKFVQILIVVVALAHQGGNMLKGRALPSIIFH